MNTGSAIAQFTVTLSQAVSEPVLVEWFTSDGTAVAGIDYAANKGTVTFAPGETEKNVEILVYGRPIDSPDVTFYVNMLPPLNAILGAPIGEVFIHVDTSGTIPVAQIIVATGPVGPNGDKGDKGDTGDSAYETWLALGNTGTEQDFIDSLSDNTFDRVADAVSAFDGDLTGSAAETPVPAHSDPVLGTALNAQAQALLDRTAFIKMKLGAFVVPEQFGNTSTPASTAAMLNAAANHCRTTGATLVAGANAYTISAEVNLRSVSLDFSDAIVTVEDGCMLTIGGDAGTRINPSQKIKAVKKPRAWSLNPADYPVASLRVMGSKAQTITIGQVDRVLFYMSTDPATYPKDASQAYSKFNIDVAIVIDIDTDPAYAAGPQADGPSSANQWFNENQFYLGSNVAFLMRGSYPHNNNRVHGGCYETANAIINIESGNKNWWTDTRLEGAASVAFGENTLGNIIDACWFSSTAQMYQRPPAGGSVTDNGKMNIVRDVRVPPSASDCVMLVTSRDTIHNGQPSNYNFRSSTRRSIRSIPRTTARIIADTDLFDAQKGDYFFASLESLSGTSSSYILRIYLYDSEFKIITGNAENLETGSFTNIFSDRAEGRVSDALLHHRFGILNSACRYVRVELLTSGSASEDNAVRVQINRVSRAPGRSRQSEIKNTKTGRFGFVTSTPTQFVGQVGDLIAGSATDFRCVFFLDTTLTIAASTSAVVITTAATAVSGLGSVAVNDLIGIDLDDGTTHWTTISAIGGGNITLTTGLVSAAAIGSRVYVSRLSPR